jgi:DNA-binding transcriptional LysR family regulator
LSSPARRQLQASRSDIGQRVIDYRWEFEKRGKRLEVAVDGPVVTNHADIGVAAALNGLGLVYHFDRDGVADHLTQGRLVQVLADWSISRPGLFLYYPNRQHRPALLGAFIDCLLDKDLEGDPRKPRIARSA